MPIDYYALNRANAARYAGQPIVGAGPSNSMSAILDRYGPEAVARGHVNGDEYRRVRDASGRRFLLTRGLLPAAGAFGGGALLSSILSPATGAAAGAAGSGATGYMSPGIISGVSSGAPTTGAVGAATGPIGAGATSAARAGIGRTIGAILGSKGFEAGANVGLTLYGNRQQQKQADQARADTLQAQRETLALERERLEREMENSRLDREDARALQEAINELKKRELDAMEEQRAFERGIVEKEQSRLDAQDARREPYRQMGQAALGRLSAIWGI